MKFTFTVEVEVERESGKFAARDEIEAELRDALEGSDPGEVSGVGADGDSVYTVADWSVS
jgi:hypothetical protein